MVFPNALTSVTRSYSAYFMAIPTTLNYPFRNIVTIIPSIFLIWNTSNLATFSLIIRLPDVHYFEPQSWYSTPIPFVRVADLVSICLCKFVVTSNVCRRNVLSEKKNYTHLA